MFMGPIMELQLLIIYQHITITVHMSPRLTIHMATRNTIQDPMGNMGMAMPILIMELITMTITEDMTSIIIIQHTATEDIMVLITDMAMTVSLDSIMDMTMMPFTTKTIWIMLMV